MTKIYHNPRCRKSRETLQLLEEKGENIEIVLYLETSPSKEELSHIIELLGIAPIDLVRKGESIWKEQFKGKEMTPTQVINAMVKHPKLIERPIVIKNGRAALGRPPENVITIL
ncbi:MAG: arsenate reductase (glutaredoxin) [Flavobacteriaceae bacterium]|nr:arsenate reductase (glutaredoxin) [Flavobacteriaceae bacterium]